MLIAINERKDDRRAREIISSVSIFWKEVLSTINHSMNIK